MRHMLLSVISGFLLLSGAVFGQEQPQAGGGFLAQSFSCETDLRLLNQISGWQTTWPAQWAALRAGDETSYLEAAAFWAGAGEVLEADIEALRTGLASGRATPRVVAIRVMAQLDGLIDEAVITPPGRSDAQTPSAGEQAWLDTFERDVLPALENYRSFLAETYLPAAPESPGLSRLPDGEACYMAAARFWTSLEVSEPELTQTGERLLAEFKTQLSDLADVPEAEIPGYVQTLREPAEAEGVTGEELVAISEAAIARAEAALPQIVDETRVGPVVVEPMNEAMERSFPAGFYRPGGPDRPGAYVINRSRPEDRRLMAEVIAFHETVPGHHLEGEVVRQADGLGEFNSGFVEGWALYSEFLAEELGLFSSDFDEIGSVAKHLWASSRLVIEPGLHLHGWSRDQAVEFLVEHSPLSLAEAELEVDRYIAMPGQSLSYMLGAEVIRELRRDAEARLGARFRLQDFHRIVLRTRRSLSVVQDDVEAWVSAMETSGALQ